MKKLLIPILASLFCITSCNRGTGNADNSTSDAKVGGSLSVDSLKPISSGMGNPKTKSLDSIDTVAKIKPSANPAMDTVKTKIP